MHRNRVGSRGQVLKIGLAMAILRFLMSTPALGEQKAENQARFELRARSNLVVVRVVVRDAQGKPVAGLQKDDFHLFDKGKEQVIKQFEVESFIALPSNARPGKALPPTAMPGKFLALYFDDLNTSEMDMLQARDAADHYLSANLQPKDRVAIFTSANMLSNFTADPKQIHDALLKLHSSPRALTRIGDCPSLSDYQAQQIARFEDDYTIDAWKVALDEVGSRCPNPNPVPMIQMLARNIVSQAEIQSRTSLQELERIVQYMSQVPGQRTVVLVSPGFMSESEQYQLDQLIDRALRAQVVISSLDPKGLALLMRESDIARSYTPSANSGVIGAMHSVDSGRELVATDVLAEIAQGTGGEFFHNNDDLKAGFRALTGSPVYYILAFAPADMKPDGKFHALKVTLADKQKGVTIRARRGYFAPKNEQEADAEVKQQEASAAEAQAEAQIREAIFSHTEMQQLPVALAAKLAQTANDSRELSLFAHLDAAPLHFHKDGEHNLNTVIFVFAIFDEKGDLVTTQERRAHVDLPDAKLPGLVKAGVDVGMSFKLKPGIYRVREVVADSEEHHMTAVSRNIDVQ